MIDNFNQVKKEANSTLRKIGEQYYITNKSVCYKITTTAAIIFNTCGSDITMCSFVKRMATKFNFHDMTTIENDVRSFLDFLIKNKLVDMNSDEVL